MPSKLDAVWLDGEICSRSTACVPIESRAFRYGDAAFATLLCRDRRLLAADRHLERLRSGCEQIGLRPPNLIRDPASVVDVLVRMAIPDTPTVVRIQVTARSSSRGYARQGPDAWALVEMFDAPIPRPVRARLQPPNAGTALPAAPGVKTGSALSHVLAARTALEMGADELIRTAGGWLTEAIASNVFWLSSDKLFTPAADLPLYPGVTRDTMIEAARNLGLTVETGRYPGEALAAADAILLTNAVRGVESVLEMDGRPVGSPDAVAALRDECDSVRAAEALLIPDGVGS